MDDLFDELRHLVRHPVRANVEIARAVADTELGRACVTLVRHPIRTLRTTFGLILDDIGRGLR
ncbi:hypothetical protein QRX50_31525 [Amycolatopsis carbonis]|uniref:Uncharacterized protein n=1 Tax=Amycolatopsis carbonis TaxID=715471 RepID=A0A9Y2IB20_9PSEU|nr:hypothetical protein [Amycolatopsis sp. 2-15]WIX75991.1 hypothetical protein QRX50_31525 [Amycolatopsis sp. 2-15]